MNHHYSKPSVRDEAIAKQWAAALSDSDFNPRFAFEAHRCIILSHAIDIPGDLFIDPIVLILRMLPYELYLQSDHWAVCREYVLDTSPRCVNCDADTYLNIHHRRYDCRAFESPECLTTLCRGCHRTFHEKRSVRPTHFGLSQQAWPQKFDELAGAASLGREVVASTIQEFNDLLADLVERFRDGRLAAMSEDEFYESINYVEGE